MRPPGRPACCQTHLMSTSPSASRYCSTAASAPASRKPSCTSATTAHSSAAGTARALARLAGQPEGLPSYPKLPRVIGLRSGGLCKVRRGCCSNLQQQARLPQRKPSAPRCAATAAQLPAARLPHPHRQQAGCRAGQIPRPGAIPLLRPLAAAAGTAAAAAAAGVPVQQLPAARSPKAPPRLLPAAPASPERPAAGQAARARPLVDRQDRGTGEWREGTAQALAGA